jgi:hypothetical protein
MARRPRTGLAVLATIALMVGCTDGTPTSDPPRSGWQAVSFEGVRFEVPADWPVTTAENWQEFGCTTTREDGVFLPPAGRPEPTSCMLPPEYGVTLHVLRYSGGQRPPAGAEVIGSGAGLRWVTSTPGDRGRSVTFPERRVQLVFYEVDVSSYEAIVASVAGSRAQLRATALGRHRGQSVQLAHRSARGFP